MPSVSLGTDIHTKQPVHLDDSDRSRGLYIIGTTGTGKTSLMRSLIQQDILNGHGVAVLDPHDLIDQVLQSLPSGRVRDVVLLDPRDAAFPFGLNPFWCNDPTNVELVSRKAGQAYG